MRDRLSKLELQRIESPTTKYCSGCKALLPLGDFSPDIRRRRGLDHYCRRCLRHRKTPASREKARIKQQQYLAARKDHYNDKNLYLAHGITREQYNVLYESQRGLCAICSRPETTRHQNGRQRNLAVDHDHQTGTIRGLLCGRCNPGIGFFQHNPDYLDRAAMYLRVSR